MDFDPSQLDPSFSHKDRYMSKKEDVDAINGALGNVNPFRTVNCTICTTAYEMRRRGYDVKANSLLNGGGPKSLWNVCDFFKDASINDWGYLSSSYIDKDESECRRAVKKELMAMGKGARGNFFTHLNTDLTTMCHSVIFEVDDNDVHFIDAQTKKWYTYEEGIKMFKTRPGGLWDNTTGSFWLRTDDKELNFDVLKHFVSDVGGKTKRSETGRSSKREMLSKAAGAAKTVVRKVRSSEPARKYTSTIDNARLQGSLARMEIRDRTAESLARSSDALRNARSAVNNASRQVRSSNTIQTARSAVDNARLQGSLAKMELRDKFNR